MVSISNLSLHIKQDLETNGLHPLKFSKSSKTINSFVPTFKLSQKRNECVLIRFPFDQKAEFDKELQIQELLKLLGLDSCVYKANVIEVELRCEKVWQIFKKGLPNTTKNVTHELYNRITSYDTLAEAIECVSNLSSDELYNLWDTGSDCLVDSHENILRKRILVRLVLKIFYLNQSTKKTINDLSFDTLVLSSQVNSCITNKDVRNISKSRTSELMQALGIRTLDKHTLKPLRFLKTMGELNDLEKFFKVVSFSSFENLLFASLLFRLYITPWHIGLFVSKQGECELYICQGPLKPIAKLLNFNFLLNFPQIKSEISSRFRNKLEKMENILPEPHKCRFEKLKKLIIHANSWHDVVIKLNKKLLVLNRSVDVIRERLISVKENYRKVKSYFEVISLEVGEITPSILQTRKSLEAIVSQLMPRAIECLMEFAEGTDYLEERVAFIENEDLTNKCWLGDGCCRAMSEMLGLMLRANGFNVSLAGSFHYDHSYLKLKITEEYVIYIDPTFRQGFKHLSHCEIINVPAVFIGTSEELRNILTKYDITNFSWIDISKQHWASTYSLDYSQRCMNESSLKSSLNDVDIKMYDTLNNKLSQAEKEALQRYHISPIEMKIEKPAFRPVADVIKKLVQPYVKRIIAQKFLSKRYTYESEDEYLDMFNYSFSGFFGYLLHTFGYEVHFKNQAPILYLSVKDFDGSSKIVVPFLFFNLSNYFPLRPFLNESLQEVFIGTIDEFNQLIGNISKGSVKSIIEDDSVIDDHDQHALHKSITDENYISEIYSPFRWIISAIHHDFLIWGDPKRALKE